MATAEEMRKAARDLRAEQEAQAAAERADVQRKSDEINATLLRNEIHRVKGEPLEELPHQGVSPEALVSPVAATPPMPPAPPKDPAPIDDKAGK